MAAVGDRAKRLTFLGHSSEAGIGLFSCDCGAEVRRLVYSVFHGNTGSCGCLKRDMMVERNSTHRLSRTPEYGVWTGMIQRCHNPKRRSFKTYGAKGIVVCPRWRDSFSDFMSDMGPRPSAKHSIERDKNEGPYSPENCRWATDHEQAGNKSNNVNFEFQGKVQHLRAWSREVGVAYHTLYDRYRAGWSIHRMLTTPARANRRSTADIFVQREAA